jgi:hypothetical protein
MKTHFAVSHPYWRWYVTAALVVAIPACGFAGYWNARLGVSRYLYRLFVLPFKRVCGDRSPFVPAWLPTPNEPLTPDQKEYEQLATAIPIFLRWFIRAVKEWQPDTRTTHPQPTDEQLFNNKKENS